MIKYNFKGFLDGKRVEFTATGESWKEILNKLLSHNMETKQDKFEIDLNKSEVIRACILLSIDTIRNTPSLAKNIDVKDRKDHQIRS